MTVQTIAARVDARGLSCPLPIVKTALAIRGLASGDLLEVLATDPVHYLMVPRVWATVLMLPLLIVFADVVGIVGGYLISVVYFGANPVTYMENSFRFMDWDDVTSGLIKAAVFGGIIAVVGCQKGYFTRGGAEGVGRSTTRAVVLASIAILISDFFLTKILY